MILAHRDLLLLRPLPEQVTKPTILIAVGVTPYVLIPKRLASHTLDLKLAPDILPIREPLGATVKLFGTVVVKDTFKNIVIPVLRYRP